MKLRNGFALAWLLVAASSADASSLGVEPVSIDIAAPRKTSTLTLRNEGDDAVTTQIRIYRWTRNGGEDELVPTKDVVASPPAARIKPNSKYTVRIVRVGKTPVAGEETYRLLVDQLPKPAKVNGPNVSFAVRYSIPVFFNEPAAEAGPLSWSASMQDGALKLAARNAGDRRIKVSGLTIKGPGGDQVVSEGLAGYVLGKSRSEWTVKPPAGIAAGSKITIIAKDDRGPIQATAKVGP
jgi:fimbrial chaperone protein